MEGKRLYKHLIIWGILLDLVAIIAIVECFILYKMGELVLWLDKTPKVYTTKKELLLIRITEITNSTAIVCLKKAMPLIILNTIISILIIKIFLKEKKSNYLEKILLLKFPNIILYLGILIFSLKHVYW